MSTTELKFVDDIIGFLMTDSTQLKCFSDCDAIDNMFLEQKKIEYLRAVVEATSTLEMPQKGDVNSHLNFLTNIMGHRAIKSFIVRYLKDAKEIVEHRDKKQLMECITNRCGMDDERVKSVFGLLIQILKLVNDSDIQRSLGELTKATLSSNESIEKMAKKTDESKPEESKPDESEPKESEEVVFVEVEVDKEDKEDKNEDEKRANDEDDNEDKKPKEKREKKFKKNKKYEPKD
jgi:hypothetical protein